MQCENVSEVPICCENGHFVESCEAVATTAPYVGINDRVANDSDMLHSVLKILTRESISVCRHLIRDRK